MWQQDDEMKVRCEGGIQNGKSFVCKYVTNELVMTSENGKYRQSYRWNCAVDSDGAKIFMPTEEAQEANVLCDRQREGLPLPLPVWWHGWADPI
jgi:hypothetical protein